MTNFLPKVAALTFLSLGFSLLPAVEAKPKRGGKVSGKVSGRASFHERTSKMVTAARVPRGSKLWVWHGNKPESSGFAVTVNDSGPYVRGRVLDLSTGAFKRLFGSLKSGHGPVHYRVLKRG